MRQIMQKWAELVGLCGICPIMRKIMRAHNRIIQRSLVKPKAAKCQQCLVTNKQSVRLSINSHQRFLFTGRFLLTSRLSLLSSGILITLQQRQPECATTFKMQWLANHKHHAMLHQMHCKHSPLLTHYAHQHNQQHQSVRHAMQKNSQY